MSYPRYTVSSAEDTGRPFLARLAPFGQCAPIDGVPMDPQIRTRPETCDDFVALAEVWLKLAESDQALLDEWGTIACGLKPSRGHLDKIGAAH
jgi:hypothetical protein